jgi:1-aminocyclopropane-1-carboxylate deaminase/D-cysteine desulfhydrase-like pyridoxal-dependent ACC family enzyme
LLKPDLWIKDEGACAPLLGGHRVRNLEWILGEAVESGGDVLVLGQAGSLALAAAVVHGQPVGVRVQVVLLPDQDSEENRKVLRLIHAGAEKIWPCPKAYQLPAIWLKAWTHIRVIGRFQPVWSGPGMGLPTGWQGWVQGGLELAEQLGPHQPTILVPAHTGLTAVALALGLGLGGWLGRVVAFSQKAVSPAILIGWHQLIRQKLRAAGLPSRQAAALESKAAIDEDSLIKSVSGPKLLLKLENHQEVEPLLCSSLHQVPTSLRFLLK